MKFLWKPLEKKAPDEFFCLKTYRYGFNGMEKDNEVSGAGNSYTAEFWQYDSRLGRRWNIDPVIKEWESPYACLRNSPIRIIDPNGDDGYVDEDGNYLGDDKDEESHETRVINKDLWTSIVGDKPEEITAEMRDQLQNGRQMGNENGSNVPKDLGPNSKLLNEYEKGINISDETWQKIEGNGGEKLTPYVVNNSDRTVFYKPEGKIGDVVVNPYVDPAGAYPVAPHTSLYSPVDGVSTHKYIDAVFKVTTGTNNIQIDMEGNINVSKHAIAVDGWIVHGGWYYRNGGLIKTPPLNDGTWENLYIRAKMTGGEEY